MWGSWEVLHSAERTSGAYCSVRPQVSACAKWIKTGFVFSFHFDFCIYLFMCLCVCHGMDEGQRTAFRNCFSSSALWTPGIESRLSDLVASSPPPTPIQPSHLTGLKRGFWILYFSKFYPQRIFSLLYHEVSFIHDQKWNVVRLFVDEPVLSYSNHESYTSINDICLISPFDCMTFLYVHIKFILELLFVALV